MKCISDLFIKLLEAIGAISTSERATAEKTNFQENVTLPTDRRCDDNVVVQEDLPEDDNTFDASVDNNDSILTAIWKVSVDGLICRFLTFFSSEKLFVLFGHPLSAARLGLLK
jgi:hypothetical protein